MSKSIEIKGIYKNNKSKVVGTHLPTEGDFTQENINFLSLMIYQELQPIKDKFKKVNIKFYNDGKLFFNKEYDLTILNYESLILAGEIIEIYNFYNSKLVGV